MAPGEWADDDAPCLAVGCSDGLDEELLDEMLRGLERERKNRPTGGGWAASNHRQRSQASQGAR